MSEMTQDRVPLVRNGLEQVFRLYDKEKVKDPDKLMETLQDYIRFMDEPDGGKFIFMGGGLGYSYDWATGDVIPF